YRKLQEVLALVGEERLAILGLHQGIEKLVEVISLAGPLGVEYPGARDILALFRFLAHRPTRFVGRTAFGGRPKGGMRPVCTRGTRPRRRAVNPLPRTHVNTQCPKASGTVAQSGGRGSSCSTLVGQPIAPLIPSLALRR